jgi:hypothetical protein
VDFADIRASAETELREAILSEFLKAELPAPIALLRHCEQYAVRMFDVWAEQSFGMLGQRDYGSSEYHSYLRNLRKMLPNWFFGCSYIPPGPTLVTASAPDPGSPWGRCVEYAMLARVDHGSDSTSTEEEIFGRYLRINGHLFISYALQTRIDVWLSRAPSKTSEEAQEPQSAHKTLKDLLDVARKKYPRLSKERFAERMGIERSVYFDLQAGRPVSKETYQKASDFTGIPIDDLKGFDPAPTKPTD